MTARRPSRGGGLGIEARAEVARCAAKAWTAQYSTAQSMVGGTTATTVGDLELRVSEQPALDDRHVVCPKDAWLLCDIDDDEGSTARLYKNGNSQSKYEFSSDGSLKQLPVRARRRDDVHPAPPPLPRASI